VGKDEVEDRGWKNGLSVKMEPFRIMGWSDWINGGDRVQGGRKRLPIIGVKKKKKIVPVRGTRGGNRSGKNIKWRSGKRIPGRRFLGKVEGGGILCAAHARAKKPIL